jgi:hypothetical protein
MLYAEMHAGLNPGWWPYAAEFPDWELRRAEWARARETL